MDELREMLASEQHAIWAHWMKYLFSVSAKDASGNFLIGADHAGRWIRQMNTPYAELTEREKASDRAQVDKFWPLIVAGVKEQTLVTMKEILGGLS